MQDIATNDQLIAAANSTIRTCEEELTTLRAINLEAGRSIFSGELDVCRTKCLISNTPSLVTNRQGTDTAAGGSAAEEDGGCGGEDQQAGESKCGTEEGAGTSAPGKNCVGVG